MANRQQVNLLRSSTGQESGTDFTSEKIAYRQSKEDIHGSGEADSTDCMKLP